MSTELTTVLLRVSVEAADEEVAEMIRGWLAELRLIAEASRGKIIVTSRKVEMAGYTPIGNYG